ncbi:hypothetical protein [Brevundimonas goettingensis]|uniref:Uncharacterized protein n=1 Tax=Brevundimonas goettingensis TaxID=2774190 RepID=A0A975BZ02_9CAUL|nr:hypothetical protein [Brevundimonas goettingensis]QTC90406.1 hypothetical protein IFJ75_14125 [Brevundimonas goettingensis]
MLPLMLMLVADPLAGAPTPPPAAPPVRMIDADEVIGRVAAAQQAAQRDCRNGEVHQAGDSATVRGADTRSPLSDLMFRQGDPVSVTLLLERRIGQCSVPISYDVTTPDGRLPSFPARAQ